MSEFRGEIHRARASIAPALGGITLDPKKGEPGSGAHLTALASWRGKCQDLLDPSTEKHLPLPPASHRLTLCRTYTQNYGQRTPPHYRIHHLLPRRHNGLGRRISRQIPAVRISGARISSSGLNLEF